MLRPAAYDERELEECRSSQNPPYEAFYQQFAERQSLPEIRAEHFGAAEVVDSNAIVISVDPGHTTGETASYSCLQAWAQSDGCFVLIDQWRGQVGFNEVSDVLRKGVGKSRAAVVLIEETGLGPALAAVLRRRYDNVRVVSIPTPRASKMQRAVPVMTLLRARRIKLSAYADFRNDYVREIGPSFRADALAIKSTPPANSCLSCKEMECLPTKRRAQQWARFRASSLEICLVITRIKPGRRRDADHAPEL